MELVKKYALLENLQDNKKWLDLLNIYIDKADFVEFNTLFDPQKLNPEIQAIESDLVEKGTRQGKIFSSGIFQRFKLIEKVKNFILSRQYQDWQNYQFEDLSLLNGKIEILATITHENYIFALMDEQQRKYLLENGFDFGDLQELEIK